MRRAVSAGLGAPAAPPPAPSRRGALARLAAFLLAPSLLAQAAPGRERTAAAAAAAPFARVVPGYRVRFPEDEGSHPDFRVEWWYVTGWLEEPHGPLGFQVTFFRARPERGRDNPSAFAPHHVLIGHAALADPRRGRLVYAQRSARIGFGLAGAEAGRTLVWLDDWRLEQEAALFRARIAARQLSIDLTLEAIQPPLLQGEGGFSRKGPAPQSASYYYSRPQLRVAGSVGAGGAARSVRGSAWLDHEWSSSYLPEGAVGWDWAGINLADGGALMAFRMRARDGTALWAGGALRGADGRVAIFRPEQVRFAPQRLWRSPRSGAHYPVALRLRLAGLELALEPLMEDQEFDARATAGTVYWEGAVGALRGGSLLGRGYLELTGYWRPLALG